MISMESLVETQTNDAQPKKSWNTLVTTGVACGVSAVLTYPAYVMKESWQRTALSQWASPPIKKSWSLFGVQTAVRPLMRLTLNEMILVAMEQGVTRPSDQLVAGAMAGVSQAILICPLEAYTARQQMMVTEQQIQQKWWWWRTLGPSPQDRLYRAYRGVGGMAIREIVLNCTFFPLFHYLQNHWHVVPSGIVAGSICAQLVSPIEMWTTYMTHSQQTWHWWNGLRLQAPPLQLLFRGISLQALVFGPSFGLVAAIFQLT